MSDLTDRLDAIGVKCPEVEELEHIHGSFDVEAYRERWVKPALSALVTIIEQQHDEMHNEDYETLLAKNDQLKAALMCPDDGVHDPEQTWQDRAEEMEAEYQCLKAENERLRQVLASVYQSDMAAAALIDRHYEETHRD